MAGRAAFYSCGGSLLVLAACGPLAAPTAPKGAPIRAVQAAPVLVQRSVVESERVVLAGNTRGEVRPEFDRGVIADEFPMRGMQIQLRRSPERQAAAEALAADLTRAGSPSFHQWLSADQYAEQFGAAPEDLARLGDWLRSHGFSVDAPSPSRMSIAFSGTAGQVREAFGTEIHALEVKGQRHLANVSDPTIPAALAPAVEGVVSLHDFQPRPMLAAHKSQYTFPAAGYSFLAVVPADLATIYHFNPLFAAGITGQGQTIALIEDTNVFDPKDWTKFRKTFGLDTYGGGSMTTVHPGAGCADPGVTGNDSEAILDVEWASAAAPSADLQLVTCADTTTTFGGLIALQNLVNERHPPSIVSFSYGGCEAQLGAAANAAEKAVSLQAALEGVSIFVAAGDTGPDFCDFLAPAMTGLSVNGLASTAYDVAVGGTDFADTYQGTTARYWSNTNQRNFESALSYVPEIPWNDSCASQLISSTMGFAVPYGASGFCAVAGPYFTIPFAGAGGPSNCAIGDSDAGVSNGTCQGWPKPRWQHVLGNPSDGVRDLPDVSLFAADGVWNHAYVYCDSDTANYGALCVGPPSNWSLGGGTSFGTPIMAGMQALVNQVWGSAQGNPNPVYYAIARAEYGEHGKPRCDSWVSGGPLGGCVFNDLSAGDNNTDCLGPYNCFDPDANLGVLGVMSLSDSAYEPAFTAGVGWDFTSGIGSVNATSLVLNPIWDEGCDD